MIVFSVSYRIDNAVIQKSRNRCSRWPKSSMAQVLSGPSFHPLQSNNCLPLDAELQLYWIEVNNFRVQWLVNSEVLFPLDLHKKQRNSKLCDRIKPPLSVILFSTACQAWVLKTQSVVMSADLQRLILTQSSLLDEDSYCALRHTKWHKGTSLTLGPTDTPTNPAHVADARKHHTRLRPRDSSRTASGSTANELEWTITS